MKDNRYIAAIEISSSKIIGAIGRIDAQGVLHVVAVEQEKTIESVRYGVIQNMLETCNTVNTILRRLEARPSVAPRKIKSVYLGISGRSMCNISHEVSRTLSEEVEITPEIIDALHTEAHHADIDRSLKIVDVVPRTYYVNNSEIKSPIGTVGSKLRACVNLIVCRLPLERNAVKMLREKVMIGLDGVIVTPIATAAMVLSDEEKRMGCMLVDMGAETTTVSIYKGGYLRYLATLPMGSRNITRDITSLGVVEEKAESIKISSGNALDGFVGHSLQIEGLNSTDLAKMITWRSTEIITNIVQQITYAGFSQEQLSGGIVTVGGGFRLNRMDDLLRNKSSMKVRNGSLPAYVDLEDTKAQAYESIDVIALLLAASKLNDNNSLETPVVEDLPSNGEEVDLPEDEENLPEKEEKTKKTAKPRKPSKLDILRQKLENMFGGSDDEEEDEFQ